MTTALWYGSSLIAFPDNTGFSFYTDSDQLSPPFNAAFNILDRNSTPYAVQISWTPCLPNPLS